MSNTIPSTPWEGATKGRYLGGALRPHDAEALHPRAEGAGIEAELLGGVALAVDLPVRALEHTADVRALDVVEALEAGLAGRAVGREGQHLLHVQRGTRREDERPVDHVLELADVPGPRVCRQRFHRALRHALDAPSELDLAAG